MVFTSTPPIPEEDSATMIFVAYGVDRTAEHTRTELAIHSFGGPPKGWRVDLVK
jgi:hypothetical protein